MDDEREIPIPPGWTRAEAEEMAEVVEEAEAAGYEVRAAVALDNRGDPVE